MSAEVCSMSETSGNHGGLHPTTVGGLKPLHRFLRGQPKIIGTVVLVLGTSFVIVTSATVIDLHEMQIWPKLPVNLVLGLLFIASGILYVVTDHNPTKKTVTVSLALSIISILGVGWTGIRIIPHIGSYYSFKYRPRNEVYYDEYITTEYYVAYSSPEAVEMVTAFEAILMFYSFSGAIIFIVMSALAGAALRSTKSQAIVMMRIMPTDTPID
ncbi:unnamed protein product [Ophioblennius macclurei]